MNLHPLGLPLAAPFAPAIAELTHQAPSPLRDGVLDVLGVDGAVALCGGGGGEGVVGDAMDEPGESACALRQRLDGGGFEQGEFAAGEPQAVGEGGVEFGAVDAGERVAYDEALGERFVHGHSEAAA